MDSIQRYEFHAIFDRVTRTIDLQYCTSALAIEQKLIEARNKSRAKSKIYRTKASAFGRKAEWLDRLIEHDFAGRAIFEAHRNPHGFIAMTLIYGRQGAMLRIEAQRKTAIRSRLAYGAIPRVAETLRVPGAPRRPEFSRIPTHRRRRWRQWL